MRWSAVGARPRSARRMIRPSRFRSHRQVGERLERQAASRVACNARDTPSKPQRTPMRRVSTVLVATCTFLPAIFAQSGRPLFPAAQYPAGSTPVFVASADFNGDGPLDLAVVNLSGGDVSMLYGNGLSTFGTAVSLVVSIGNGPRCLAVGDFNDDGRPDLATANNYANNVSVFINSAAGGFLPATTIAVGDDPYWI